MRRYPEIVVLIGLGALLLAGFVAVRHRRAADSMTSERAARALERGADELGRLRRAVERLERRAPRP